LHAQISLWIPECPLCCETVKHHQHLLSNRGNKRTMKMKTVETPAHMITTRHETTTASVKPVCMVPRSTKLRARRWPGGKQREGSHRARGDGCNGDALRKLFRTQERMRCRCGSTRAACMLRSRREVWAGESTTTKSGPGYINADEQAA
jgi:hypothetical protein